jgi:hypothetical protein
MEQHLLVEWEAVEQLMLVVFQIDIQVHLPVQ